MSTMSSQKRRRSARSASDIDDSQFVVNNRRPSRRCTETKNHDRTEWFRLITTTWPSDLIRIVPLVISLVKRSLLFWRSKISTIEDFIEVLALRTQSSNFDCLLSVIDALQTNAQKRFSSRKTFEIKILLDEKRGGKILIMHFQTLGDNNITHQARSQDLFWGGGVFLFCI